jgi:hypothetical protein
VLDCYFGISPLSRIGIYLARKSDTANQYVRTRPWNIKEYPPGKTPTGKWSTIYVKQRHPFQLPKTWGDIIPEASQKQHGCEVKEICGDFHWHSRILWSPRQFYGKISAIKYGNLADNDIVSEMVVVVGMEDPSRVWCTMGICDGKSLEEYFLLIPDSHTKAAAKSIRPFLEHLND